MFLRDDTVSILNSRQEVDRFFRFAKQGYIAGNWSGNLIYSLWTDSIAFKPLVMTVFAVLILMPDGSVVESVVTLPIPRTSLYSSAGGPKSVIPAFEAHVVHLLKDNLGHTCALCKKPALRSVAEDNGAVKRITEFPEGQKLSFPFELAMAPVLAARVCKGMGCLRRIRSILRLMVAAE